MTAVAAIAKETAAETARVTTTAADRYALALYELAADAGSLPAVERDMAALAAAVAGSKDMKRTLRHPLITRAQQTRVLTQLADKMGANQLTKKFLSLVAGKKRQADLLAIAASFAAQCAARRGEVTAEVTSAAPLSPAQADELARVLSAKHKADVKLQVTVDPSLLGGMKIKIGAKLYDRTIQSQLQRLQVQLQEAA